MMELLPDQGWSDIVRTGDIQQLTISLNDRITAESALLRAEMSSLRTELKTDMAELRAELKTDMANFRTDVTGEIGRAFAEFRDELHREHRAMQRQVILALVAALITVVITAAGLT